MNHQTWRCPALADEAEENGPPRRKVQRRSERLAVESALDLTDKDKEEEEEEEGELTEERGKLVIKINMAALQTSNLEDRQGENGMDKMTKEESRE